MLASDHNQRVRDVPGLLELVGGVMQVLTGSQAFSCGDTNCFKRECVLSP